MRGAELQTVHRWKEAQMCHRWTCTLTFAALSGKGVCLNFKSPDAMLHVCRLSLGKLTLGGWPGVQGQPGLQLETGSRQANMQTQGWRRAAVVRSTCCSFREPEFGSKHLHWLAHKYSNSSLGALTPLFWPPRALALICTNPHRDTE